MNLFKFDFNNYEITPDTVTKKVLPPSLPLFERAGWVMPLSFSRSPASLLVYTVF